MNEKFTPAPWKIGAPPPNGEMTIGTTSGLMVCVATTGGVPTEANAALIAAAPEMYEMLSKLSMQLTAINARKAANDIEQLLAKARGEV